jgi:predicted nucleic acid-binding protein
MTELGRPIRALVVDASFVVDVLEGDHGQRDLWATVAEADAAQLVPPHFWSELANALLKGIRMRPVEVARRLERMAASGIEVADRGLPGLIEAVELADRHGLTVYDALYLQLAIDVDAELATADKDLARAARTEDVLILAG